MAAASALSPEPLPLPQSDEQVADWASGEWRRLVAAGCPSLLKAMLLLALEEEAAAVVAAGGPGGGGELAPLAIASSWSLRRLDLLAAEAAAAFYGQLRELEGCGAVQLAVAGGAPDSTLWTLHADLVAGHPFALLTAVNNTLFERHGYRRRASRRLRLRWKVPLRIASAAGAMRWGLHGARPQAAAVQPPAAQPPARAGSGATGTRRTRRCPRY